MRRRSSRRRSKRRRALLVVLAGCFGIAVGVVTHATDVLHRVELLAVDARFDVRGPQPPPDDIVVVGIDDRTISDYPSTPYPFPRRLHARVIDRLVDAGARVIAYDIQFTEPSSSERDDNALVDAVGAARGTGSSSPPRRSTSKGRTRVLGGDDLLLEIGARAGNAVVPADAGGVIRRMPYEVDGLLGVRRRRRPSWRPGAPVPAVRGAAAHGSTTTGRPARSSSIRSRDVATRPSAGLRVPRPDRGRGRRWRRRSRTSRRPRPPATS